MKIESVCCSVFEIWPRKLHHHSPVDPNSMGRLNFRIGLNSRVNALLSWDGVMIGALARRQQLGGRWDDQSWEQRQEETTPAVGGLTTVIYHLSQEPTKHEWALHGMIHLLIGADRLHSV